MSYNFFVVVHTKSYSVVFKSILLYYASFSFSPKNLVFSPRQNFLSLFFGKFSNFLFGGFECKMQFGESFVFPDPASRVSHEPLKLDFLRFGFHITQERTNLGSERVTKVNVSISAGALR